MPKLSTHPKIDFYELNREVKMRARDLLQIWAPGGKFQGKYYIPCNPTREDKNPGSFKIDFRTGAWFENATGEHGGDFVSFWISARPQNSG